MDQVDGADVQERDPGKKSGSYQHTDGNDKIVGTVDKQKRRGPWTNPRGILRDERENEEPVRTEQNKECNVLEGK